MRPLNGLGLPNCTWTTFTEREERAITELRAEAWVVLGYPDSPILAQKAAQETRLWDQLGRPTTLLRAYASDIFFRDPADWARTFVNLVKLYRAAGMDVEGVGDNEPRIEAPALSVVETTAWRKIFAQEVKGALPDLRLHMGADAPDDAGEYLADWQYQADQGLQKHYDVRDAHAYTLTQLAHVLVARRIFGRPVWVTEYNRMMPSQVLAWATAAEAVCWFILSGEGGENLEFFLLDSPYYEDFKTAGQTAPAPVEGIPAITPLSGEAPMPDFQVGEGIRTAMGAEEPVEDEQYLGDRVALCASTEALYVYSKGANRVARLPFV